MYLFLSQTYFFWDLSFNVINLLLGLTTSNYALFSLHPHPLSFDFYVRLSAFFSISKSTWYWNNLLTQLPTLQFSSVQLVNCDWLFVTPWTAAHQASLSFTSSQSLLKLTSIESNGCHATNSSTVVPFSSCLQCFPASRSLPMNQFFASSVQSIGVSASASVLPMNIQDWFPIEWTGWISVQSKGLSRVFSNMTVQKHQFFGTQLSL